MNTPEAPDTHTHDDYSNVNASELVFITEQVYPPGQYQAVSYLEKAGYEVIPFCPASFDKIPEDDYTKNANKFFVLIFNNNSRSHQHIKKNIECFKSLGIENYKIALPPNGVTWDDLIRRNQLESYRIEETLKQAYLQGELFFAESALDYFNRYRKQHPDTKTLIFEFDSSMFKGYLKNTKASSDIDVEVKLLADCSIQLRYFVIDDIRKNNPKIEYYLNLHSEYERYERDSKAKLTAAELVQLNSFKLALQNNGQVFYGNSRDLSELTHYLFETQPQKVIALSAIGYDEMTKYYFFPNFTYGEDGTYSHQMDEYINAVINNGHQNIKPFMDCNDRVIEASYNPQFDRLQFINLLNRAYSHKGILALGFYISSLFSHIVFEKYGFFPFLSLYGDPHTGKSFISKLLNRCFFIDSEGQTITASNTVKDHLIKISQKSNLVCALLEGGKNSRFDYDSILTLYNRNPLYSPASDSSNSRTHDLHLKASLSFVWNHEHFTTQAAKERVISLHFANTDINESTKQAWTELSGYRPEQLANIGDFLLKNRKFFETNLISTIDRYTNEFLNKGVTISRIAENYAIALGGITGLYELLKINDNNFHLLLYYTIECAKHKQLETSKSELHFANYFLESIHDFNLYQGVANHNSEVVIHLPTALNSLKQKGNDFDKNKRELITELKKHERFITVKSTRCFGNPCDAYHFKSKPIQLVNY